MASVTELEPLGQLLARILGSDETRQHLIHHLDASPYRERKLHFQAYLGELRGSRLSESQRRTLDSLITMVAPLQPLELYFPIQEHRARWRGEDQLQVAVLVHDDDDPVSFKANGPRQVLARDAVPTMATLVLTPAEQSFDRVLMPSAECNPDLNPGCDEGSGGGGGGGGGQSADTSLYLTRLKIDDDYEGLFKGDPEFEVHILGPNSTGDSLRTHQCTGAQAGHPYQFDYNDTDQTWTGNVLLFSKAQLASYRSTYPGKAFRVFVLEDDDESCVPRLDATQFSQFANVIETNFPGLDGTIDSTFNLVRTVKAAGALVNIISSVISFFQSKDEMVGVALEDSVVGEYYSGANWIIRGPGNATNGYMKLEMKP